ncbi:MAG: hypothetical protein WB902_27785, partial [Acetobacteraceae bacterium]
MGTWPSIQADRLAIGNMRVDTMAMDERVAKALASRGQVERRHPGAMTMVETSSPDLVLRLTVQIVAAHVEHNVVPAEALPTLIEQVYR